MKIRKLLGYPPYFNLCLIKIKSSNYDLVNNVAIKIANHLKKIKDITVLGPSPGLIPKINDKYNMQIIVKYKKTVLLNELIFIDNIYKNKKVLVDIDLNPIKI